MRSAARAVGALFLFALVSLAACSSDGTTGAAAAAPTTLSAEARTFVAQLCAVEQPCCAPGVTSTCAASAGAFGLGKDFDAAKAADCLEQLRAAVATSGACDRAPDVFACEGVFKTFQAVATGKGCASSADCANPAGAFGLCVGSGANARCRAVTRGKPGDACVGTRASGTTADLPGAETSATALCFLADGLQCDARSKRCAIRAIVGSDCDPANEAACVGTAFCPVASRQCTTRTTPGSTCTDSDECEAGYHCTAASAGANDDVTAVCIAYAQKGAACPRGDEGGPSLSCASGTATCIEDATAAVRACNGKGALGL